MAYMNQEKKKAIAVELKKVVPANWKYSLSVKHHSSIVFTVSAGPKELAICKDGEFRPYRQLNDYHLESNYNEGEILEAMLKIKDALNLNNHDRSDLMTDYFDVGHYVDMNIGKWDRPFVAIN